MTHLRPILLFKNSSHPDPFEGAGMPPTYDSMKCARLTQTHAFIIYKCRLQIIETASAVCADPARVLHR